MPVLVSYAAFVLVGVSAGAGGVLLLAQMDDYGVGRATIGITFFTASAGFAAAGLSTGALIGRFGVRIVLAVGAGALIGPVLAAGVISFASWTVAWLKAVVRREP